MPVISELLTHRGGMPSSLELQQQLLTGSTLLSESEANLIEVVDVL